MRSLPQPTLFWVDADSNVAKGLYVSPNALAFPEVRRKPGYSSRMRPDPWKYYFTQFMSDATLPLYWTAISPRRQVFDSFLAPLNQIYVESFDVNGNISWRLSEAALAEWQKIEDLLQRCFRAVNSTILTRLDVDVTSQTIVWPSAYGYDQVFPTRSKAISALRTVRAVFMLQVTRLSYCDFLNSSPTNKWYDRAHSSGLLSLDETSNIRCSMICSKSVSFSSVDRVGMIIDVRRPFANDWHKDLERLIEAFDLPIWLYYGINPQDPRMSHHWYAKYAPKSEVVVGIRNTIPAVDGIKTLVQSVTSQREFPLAVAAMDGAVVDGAVGVGAVGDGAAGRDDRAHNHDLTAPRPDPSTRQLPGEGHKESFARVDALIKTAYANGTPEQVKFWNARMIKHSGLECPTNADKSNVFRWNEDKVRVVVGRKNWRVTFDSSAKTQRRYDPVHNEFDICEFLDPLAEYEDEQELFVYGYQAGFDMDIDEPEQQQGTKKISVGDTITSGVEQSVQQSHNANYAVSEHRPSELSQRHEGVHVSGRSPTPPRQHSSRGNVSRSRRRSRSPRRRSPSLRRRSRSPRRRSPSLRRRSPSPRRRSPSLRRRSRSPRRRSRSPRRRSRSPRRRSHSLRRRSRSPRRRSPSPRRRVSQPPHSRSPSPDYVMVHRRVLTVPDLRTALWKRYGLLSLPSGYQLPESAKEKYEWLKKPGKISTVLAHWAEDIPPDRLLDVHTYLALLCSGTQPSERPEIPCSLVDTVSGNPRGFPHSANRRVDVLPGTTEGKTWYMIVPRVRSQRDVTYDVVVDDPLTVNQILREGVGASRYEIALFLLKKGITFKTLRHCATPRSLMWPSPPVPMFTATTPMGLGVRLTSDGTFTIKDYDLYLQRRDEVISSYDGRAAFLKGGIIWRLAIDAIGDEGLVLDGPGRFPTMKNHVTFGERGYVDDVLTEHQQDIICGVYRLMPTDIKKAENRTSFTSWWPSANAWHKSGMDVGYWTSSNEKWFCDRRAKILEGKERPKTSSEWKPILRLRRADQERMLSNARDLAARSLPPAV